MSDKLEELQKQLYKANKENKILQEKLDESEKLLVNMGNEIEELYEVVKGLEEERDELKNNN